MVIEAPSSELKKGTNNKQYNTKSLEVKVLKIVLVLTNGIRMHEYVIRGFEQVKLGGTDRRRQGDRELPLVKQTADIRGIDRTDDIRGNP